MSLLTMLSGKMRTSHFSDVTVGRNIKLLEKEGMLGTQMHSVTQQGKNGWSYKNVKANTFGLEQVYRTITEMNLLSPRLLPAAVAHFNSTEAHRRIYLPF